MLSVGLLAGCGNLTAGGFGDATVLITGDGEGAGASAMTGPAPDFAAQAGAAALPPVSAPILGTLDVTLQVYVRGTDGFWSEVTPGERSASIPITGGDFEEVVSRRISEGFYQEIRLVFHSVEADVTGGLEVGGIPIIGRVRVQNSSSITVERPLNLFVDERQAMEVLIDLHAATWLSAVTVLDLEVPAEVFASSVSVSARGGG